jgi:hypothetical protein
MSKNDVASLRSCLIKLDGAFDELLKHEIITDDLELKRMVGSISAEFAGFLEIKLLPNLKLKFPNFIDM